MVKMSDIADHLGLSRLTVSAVLNHREKSVGISEETAQEVRATAAKLGYHRNHLALAMKSGRNPVVGCMVSNLKAEWVSRTLSGLLGVSAKSEYLIKIEEVYGHQSELTTLGRFMEQRVAGIFCCNFNPLPEIVSTFNQTIKKYGVSVVYSSSVMEIDGVRVDSDDEMGGRQAVQHLWDLGHRKIAYVGGTENTTAERIRRAGFTAKLTDLGGSVPPEYIVHADFRWNVAEEAARELLRSPRNRPTAIFCASDSMAAGVLRGARSVGLRIPQDLSVIGFSNMTFGELLDPPLTTVAQAFEDIGARCGQLVVELARNAEGTTRKKTAELIATSLVVRGSTAGCG